MTVFVVFCALLGTFFLEGQAGRWKSRRLKWAKVREKSRGIVGRSEEGLGLDKDRSGWLLVCVWRGGMRLNLPWSVYKVSGSKVTPVTHLGIERWWWLRWWWGAELYGWIVSWPLLHLPAGQAKFPPGGSERREDGQRQCQKQGRRRILCNKNKSL